MLALKFAFPPLYISSSDFFQLLLVSMKFHPIENTSDVNERDQCAENRHDQFQYMGANSKVLRKKSAGTNVFLCFIFFPCSPLFNKTNKKDPSMEVPQGFSLGKMPPPHPPLLTFGKGSWIVFNEDEYVTGADVILHDQHNW